jgi:cytochrome P450
MTLAEHRYVAPQLVAPARPKRALSTVELLRVGLRNTLECCDEELFDELFVERRYLWYRAFIISDPEGLRRVLADNNENYPRLDQNRRMFRFDSGSGLLSADDETWNRHRRMINPALDHRAALADAPKLIPLAEELVASLASWPADMDIDVCDFATVWMTLSAGHVFAGKDRSLDPMLQRMGVYPGRFSILDFLPLPRWVHGIDRFRKARVHPRTYYPVIDRLIAERRSPDYAGEQDLMWKLAHARDRNTGELFTLPELRDETLTLGSTAATPVRPLSWIWYLLAKHPWAEEQLHDELDRVLGDRTPTVEDIGKLTFLRRLVDETMRLYPPLPSMFRVALADDEVCGRKIPRNSIISVVPWIVHRHRKLWDEPDAFDPDRFSPERSAARSRYAYLPFSIGPHVCIGASLSIMQILIGTAALARRFRVRLVPDFPIVPTAWTNLRPAHGIRAFLEPREPRRRAAAE